MRASFKIQTPDDLKVSLHVEMTVAEAKALRSAIDGTGTPDPALAPFLTLVSDAVTTAQEAYLAGGSVGGSV